MLGIVDAQGAGDHPTAINESSWLEDRIPSPKAVEEEDVYNQHVTAFGPPIPMSPTGLGLRLPAVFWRRQEQEDIPWFLGTICLNSSQKLKK